MSDENVMYPSAESARSMPSKEAAVGVELMFIHNTLVAIVNDVIEKNNARIEKGEGETAESISAHGAANAFGFIIQFVEGRIKEYVTDFEKVVGVDGEPEASAPNNEA